MALVIEDGSLVASANSFVTRGEIIAYAAERGITLPDDETTDVLAIRAMDYLRTLCLKGDAAGLLPFPRTGLETGDTAEDYVLTIPFVIKLAQMQLALDASNGIDLTPSNTPELILKRSKVGPIEEEFFAPGAPLDGPPLLLAVSFLDPYLCAQGMALTTMRA